MSVGSRYPIFHVSVNDFGEDCAVGAVFAWQV